MATFFPKKESEKRQWASSFKNNLPDAANTMQLDRQEVQTMDTILDAMVANIDQVAQKELELSAAIKARNQYEEQNLPTVKELVRRWKTQPNYRQSIGQQLGIEGGGNVVRSSPQNVSSNPNGLQVSIETSSERVMFGFKYKVKRVIYVYCKRGAETEFSLVGAATNNKFEDNRLNLNNQAAEKREYVFTLVHNGQESARTAIYTVPVANY